jgi:hypothetical protein
MNQPTRIAAAIYWPPAYFRNRRRLGSLHDRALDRFSCAYVQSVFNGSAIAVPSNLDLHKLAEVPPPLPEHLATNRREKARRQWRLSDRLRAAWRRVRRVGLRCWSSAVCAHASDRQWPGWCVGYRCPLPRSTGHCGHDPSQSQQHDNTAASVHRSEPDESSTQAYILSDLLP